MDFSSKRRVGKKQALLGSLAALSVAGLATKGFYEYTAAPTKPKDCSFVFPEHTLEKEGTTITVRYPESLPLSQKGGTINDASCLNRTPIYAIVAVRREEDIRNALIFAKEQHLSVSIAGQQHSMGGHTFVPNGLVLDMKEFKNISIDTEKKMLRVEAGALWGDVQKTLDPLGLSMKAMQSINIFTVGGTLSVNAHGIAHTPGQIAPTVQSIRVMTHDGKILRASRTENSELFRHVLGGYGLFGVILDAEISVTENALYAQEDRLMPSADFPAFFDREISGNEEYGLFYARLSVAPNSYLREVATHAFRKVEDTSSPLPPLTPEGHIGIKRFVINFSKTGSFGRWLRWMLEKYVDPKIRPCEESRNALMSKPEDCITTRNRAMFDSMQYLKNRLPDTDILQEYFIPKNRFTEFVDGLRETVKRDGANLLNVTIRIVHKDDDTALPYATEDEMFALVLYFNQKLNLRESQTLEKTTNDLIALAQSVGGRFYLPYQLHYSTAALQEIYPETEEFFAMKRKYDPGELFRNTWYEKYGKQ